MSDPLVSVLLVTSGRRDMAQRALDCYRRQTYPLRELVIVDDPVSPSFDTPTGDRYSRWIGTVGARRNVGLGWSRGEFVAHWDSDDWYADDYLARMVELIQSRHAMVAGLRDVPFVDLRDGAWYRYSGPEWYVCGATMIYRRRWVMARPFQRVNVGEDAGLSWLAWQSNVLASRSAEWDFIASIHDGNTSPRDVSGPYWRKLEAREVPRWARKLWC